MWRRLWSRLRPGIRGRLIIAFLISVLVSLTISGLTLGALYLGLGRIAGESDVHPFRVGGLVRAGARAVQAALAAGAGPPAIHAAALSPDLPPGARVRVITRSGEVVVDSDGGAGRIMPSAELLELTWQQIAGHDDEPPLLTLVRPLFLGQEPWGFYALTLPSRVSPHVDLGDGSPAAALSLWLGIGGQVLAIVSSLLVFWFFGQTLVRPARQLSAVVSQIAGGDLTVRTGLDRRGDELGQLARDIDAMAASLQRARDQAAAADRARRYMVAAASHDLRTPPDRVARSCGGAPGRHCRASGQLPGRGAGEGAAAQPADLRPVRTGGPGCGP